jgi:hypothetical protein
MRLGFSQASFMETLEFDIQALLKERKKSLRNPQTRCERFTQTAGLAWARAVVVAVKEPEELLEVHPAAARSAALRQQDTRGTARQSKGAVGTAGGPAGAG